MPELPEVETIKVGLQSKIIGQFISDIEILNPKSFLGDSSKVIGAKVINIWRRGKVLGIDLIPKTQNPKTLVFHLKMSGQIIYQPSSGSTNRFVGGHPTKDIFKTLPNKSTRVIIKFQDQSKLYFNDQRKFGWIKLINTAELETFNHGLKIKLGPEPLEESFTWQALKNNLQKRKNLPVKVAILDQEILAGVGNIYASEACFIAKINPNKKIKDLVDREYKLLFKGIIKSLQSGIRYGGSSMTHFFDIGGNKGYFLKYAFVFNRENTECKICKTTIKKIKLAGRGTYYCPTCQS